MNDDYWSNVFGESDFDRRSHEDDLREHEAQQQADRLRRDEPVRTLCACAKRYASAIYGGKCFYCWKQERQAA